MFEGAKIVHALNRVTTVTGEDIYTIVDFKILNCFLFKHHVLIMKNDRFWNIQQFPNTLYMMAQHRSLEMNIRQVTFYALYPIIPVASPKSATLLVG
jgi:hypothetical protein